MFKELAHKPIPSSSNTQNKLKHFLAKPCMPVNDPLKWWAEQRTQGKYPVLSRMALDYFSIPHKWFLLYSAVRLIITSNICRGGARLLSRPSSYQPCTQPAHCTDLPCTYVPRIMELSWVHSFLGYQMCYKPAAGSGEGWQ